MAHDQTPVTDSLEPPLHALGVRDARAEVIHAGEVRVGGDTLALQCRGEGAATQAGNHGGLQPARYVRAGVTHRQPRAEARAHDRQDFGADEGQLVRMLVAVEEIRHSGG